MNVYQNNLRKFAELVKNPTEPTQQDLDSLADFYAQFSTVSYAKDGFLVASIGPVDKKGYVMSGHMDVVTFDEKKWKNPVFGYDIHEGLMYGLGTCDMRGFLSVATQVLMENKSQDLEAPIHLIITTDEETKCKTIEGAVPFFKGKFGDQIGVIVGEPSMMRPVTRHRGAYDFVTEFKGVECHGARPHEGISAAYAAAKFVSEIERTNLELAALKSTSTTNVGNIIAGVEGTINVVPNNAKVGWDIRPSNPVELDQLYKQLDAYCEKLKFSYIGNYKDKALSFNHTKICTIPPLSEKKSSFLDTVIALSEPEDTTQPRGATEAGFYQQAGLSTVIIGPAALAQAHKVDEFVSMEQLEICHRFLNRLMLNA